MSEILITIFVLSLEQEYDMFIPINMPMKEAIDLIQKNLVDLSQENYEIIENPVLYSEIDGKVINQNNIVKFSGLFNGCKVLLK